MGRRSWLQLAIPAVTSALIIVSTGVPSAQQQRQPPPAPAQPSNGGRSRPEAPIDPDRARELYVSKDPADHARGYDFTHDTDDTLAAEARCAKASQGVMDFQKVTYRSSVGDMDIPAYLFQPLKKRGPKGHAAMVWVHGGVHGNWGVNMFPFVRDAVERGYVVICPDYRGSTGYGEAHHNAIDYGGYEIDDTLSAVEYPQDATPCRSGSPRDHRLEPRRLHYAAVGLPRPAPIQGRRRDGPGHQPRVPAVVQGPSYQRQFSTQPRVQGLPFEKRDLYIARSPLYQVDKLRIPLLVHVATNDADVNYVEDQQIVDALRSRKPDLAETRVYVDPVPGPASVGHTFNRRVNMTTLERDDSPDQRDSWNWTWTFFEWHLRPYEDRSQGAKPSAPTP